MTLRAGTPARLTFVRTTDQTCATEVAVPSLKIKRALPLNKPVEIEFTPEKAGTIGVACGMNMFKGPAARWGREHVCPRDAAGWSNETQMML